VEEIARDLQVADPEWRIILLRYFNPVGAHPSGLIGEDPRGVPNNLMPFLQQVAVGRRSELTVFGKDYPTIDGTGVCSYLPHLCVVYSLPVFQHLLHVFGMPNTWYMLAFSVSVTKLIRIEQEVFRFVWNIFILKAGKEPFSLYDQSYNFLSHGFV
jgi:hypothetical protein